MKNTGRARFALAAILVAVAAAAPLALATGGNHQGGGGAIPAGSYTGHVTYNSSDNTYHVTGAGPPAVDIILDGDLNTLSENEKKGLDAAVNQNDSNNTVTVDSNNKVTNVNTG